MSLTTPQLYQFSSSNIRLALEIRLRAEYFGGLVYDTRNGKFTANGAKTDVGSIKGSASIPILSHQKVVYPQLVRDMYVKKYLRWMSRLC